MKQFVLFVTVAVLCPVLAVGVFASEKQKNVFEEKEGLVAVEAEHFALQDDDGPRKWYSTRVDSAPGIKPDPDENHAETASGKAYLEILPDTRTTHDDPLVQGVSFSNKPGELAVLCYFVQFNTPGRYYVWVRAYSTGSEDNGIHVGLDGKWPASGTRMQWCEGKRSWRWESKQRTEKNHCGEPYKIYLDVLSPGYHTVLFSMREDGFEFDKWLMTTDKQYIPENEGPAERAQN